MIFTALIAGSAAVCWVAAGYRLILTVRAPSIWSWSFTLAVTFLAAGVSCFPLSPWINSASGEPNLAQLIMHVTVTVAAGCVLVFLHTLRRDDVQPRVVSAIAALTAVAIGLITVSWLKAPFHSQDLPDIAVAPITRASGIYFCTWYVWLVVVLFLTASWCAAELRSPQPPVLRIGLRCIGLSTALGAFTFSVAGIRIVLRALTGDLWSGISTFVQISSAVTLTGIAAGTVLFAVGPQVVATLHAKRVRRDIAPLVDRLSELYPTIVLRSDRLKSHQERLQREKTEVFDGLRLLPVQPRTDQSSHEVIAEALREPAATTIRAHNLMPLATTADEEDEWLALLAETYTSI